MKNFADLLIENCHAKNSFLMIGIDPQADQIPLCFIEEQKTLDLKGQDLVTAVLTAYCQSIIEACFEHSAVIKPNIAFFETFGTAGHLAYQNLCAAARTKNLLVVADVKRGDIANTAEAYSRAFYYEKTEIFGEELELFKVDAITINPFLGLDTVAPYLADCQKTNKGAFLLCKTSNPGAEFLQNFTHNNKSLSHEIAEFANTAGENLIGTLGYSSLGVVVGATYPEQAKTLRELMPRNIFLIPGAGSQGADFQMACAGFDANNSGAIINISRALIKEIDPSVSKNNFINLIGNKANFFKEEINKALKNRIS